MVIGMRYGHSGPDDMEQRDVLIAKRSEFIDKWKAVRGSSMCRDLLEDDISTPEGFSRIIESGKLFSLCPEFVLEAIEKCGLKIIDTLHQDQLSSSMD